MRATNNEKRTLAPVTALTNFAASTILDTSVTTWEQVSADMMSKIAQSSKLL